MVQAFALLGGDGVGDHAIHQVEAAPGFGGAAQGDVGEGQHGERAVHEVPFRIAPAHARRAGVPQVGVGPQLGLTFGQLARLDRDA